MTTTISGTLGVSKTAPGSVVPESLVQPWPGFTKYFESDEFNLSSSPITFTHNFGEPPKLVYVDAECIVGEQGFNVGEIIEVPLVGTGATGASYNGCVAKTNTTVKLRFGYSGIAAISMSSGVWVSLTSANWKFKLRAWV